MLDERDFQILYRQLRRPPRGVRAIESRSPSGDPLVVRVYPLVEGKPFPTLFWLTSNEAVLELTRLEYQGVIAQIQRRIRKDGGFRTRYYENHRAYIAERWKELSPDDREWIQATGLASAFHERGIGGLKQWDTVKCLHMHYAHHLARENVIGKSLEDDYGVARRSGRLS